MFMNVTAEEVREQIGRAIAASVKAYDVPKTSVRLGIQSRVEDADSQEAFGSKRLYIVRRLKGWDQAALLVLAARVLREHQAPELQDLVSELTLHAEYRVSAMVRRDVLKVLNRTDALFGELPVMDSLGEVFGASAIHDDPGGLLGTMSLQRQIDQHFLRNPDWSNEALLTQCGALTCSQARFFTLLEKVLHPMTRRDAEQAELTTALSAALLRDGFTIRQTGVESGYAFYGVVRASTGVAGGMKNLIFASIGEKPELIFRDAINNDVEIVKHADKVLIFDRPLPSSGLLLWKDLRDWWTDCHGIDDPVIAKTQLYRRLLQAVRSSGSAGEFALFHGYYERFGSTLGDRLPALIPQIYLHYDPYTRRQRGDEQVLARQRMDLLLMLDRGVRVVIEVDGRHHYAIQDPTNPARYIAHPQRYAEMAGEDRRLKLTGYEIYRFGGAEFLDVDLDEGTVGPSAKQCATEFFDRLLSRHGVV